MNPTQPFDPEREAPLLSAYVDGELEPAEAARVAEYLAGSPEGRREVQRLRELRALTDSLQLKPAPPEAWEAFWRRFYNRAERSLGWLAFGLGVIVVGTWALYEAVQNLLGSPALPWWVKGGLVAVAAGLVILLVSVVRERVYARSRTRYKDVVR